MNMVRKGEKHDGGVSLPEDIVFDVLARVTAKALCRFRCVCKAWRALISDPAFVAAQRSRAGLHLVGVFCKAWPPQVRVMDMDGNVVRELVVQVRGKNDSNVLGMLHPATTTRPVLICALGRLQRDSCAHAVIIDLAAGRACSVGMVMPWTALPGFGRATLSGAFKVMHLGGHFPYQICNVATIMDGGAEPLTWRQGPAAPFAICCRPEKRATVNGTVYFMAYFNEHDAASNSVARRIAAFDLESEEWKMINGPAFEIQDEKGWYVTLAELKGCLAVVESIGHSTVVSEPNDDHCYAIIWLLVDPSKSVWVKENTIQLPKTWGFTKLLGALDDGRILLQVDELLKKVISKKNKITYLRKNVLVFYNPCTKTFTIFREIPVGFYNKLMLYTGSLLS